jgi:hypothetical protein
MAIGLYSDDDPDLTKEERAKAKALTKLFVELEDIIIEEGFDLGTITLHFDWRQNLKPVKVEKRDWRVVEL